MTLNSRLSIDALHSDKTTPEYHLGVRQMNEWHQQCRLRHRQERLDRLREEINQRQLQRQMRLEEARKKGIKI